MLAERTKQIKHFLAVLSIQFIVIYLALIVERKKNWFVKMDRIDILKARTYFIQHI